LEGQIEFRCSVAITVSLAGDRDTLAREFVQNQKLQCTFRWTSYVLTHCNVNDTKIKSIAISEQVCPLTATKWVASYSRAMSTRSAIPTSLKLTLFVEENPGVNMGLSHQGFSV
jgi:hypothetical protein